MIQVCIEIQIGICIVRDFSTSNNIQKNLRSGFALMVGISYAKQRIIENRKTVSKMVKVEHL